MHFLGATTVVLLSIGLVHAYSDIYARHPYYEDDLAILKRNAYAHQLEDDYALLKREAYADAFAEAYHDILAERDLLFEIGEETLTKRAYSVAGVSSACARCMAGGIDATSRNFPATLTAEQYSHLDIVGVDCTHKGLCKPGEAQKWKSGQTHPSTGQGTPEQAASRHGSPQRGSPQRGSPVHR